MLPAAALPRAVADAALGALLAALGALALLVWPALRRRRGVQADLQADLRAVADGSGERGAPCGFGKGEGAELLAAARGEEEAELLGALFVSPSDVQRLLGLRQRCGDGSPHPGWLEARGAPQPPHGLALRRRLRRAGRGAARLARGRGGGDAVDARGQPEQRGPLRGAARGPGARGLRARPAPGGPGAGPGLRARGARGGRVRVGAAAVARRLTGRRLLGERIGRPTGLLEVKTARTWGGLFEESLSSGVPSDWLYQ
ncbi:unnamed protein product, partial [Prorocentrum cordatum]